jgi:hypothetical protein
MTPTDLSSRLELLINLSVGLLGTALTLIALIPTLIQLARVKSPDFMSRMESEGSLRYVINALAAAVVALALALADGLIGLMFPAKTFLWVGWTLFIAGLAVLIGTSVKVALTTRDVM